MNGILKYTLVGGLSVSMLAVITQSHADSNKPLPKYHHVSATKTQSLPLDSPETPITNEDLPYPIHDNGYDEYIYQNNHPLELNGPSNVKNTTTYDPDKKEFLFEQKMGDNDYRPPIYMTEEEYQEYLFKKQVKSYFKSRIQADDKNSVTKAGKLIPQLNVGGELFDRIFGGNTVDIRPNGSAELQFGLVTNKNGNPAIPVKQRKITNFDFNMKVQLNLVGKIGEKLKLTTNYNTEASFDFENQMKLQYQGLEDEILKTIEAGNVTLPLPTTLITGSQSLFGIKTKMQFGKLTTTTVLSQERGKKTEVTLQGGSQTTNYTITADNYEANRHYFLSQYFRDHYNQSMSTIPMLSSNVVITKIEVWVTNRANQQDEVRNIVGFADLGEDSSKIIGNLMDPNCTSPGKNITGFNGTTPYNGANNLYSLITDTLNGILKDRVFSEVTSKLKDNTTYPNSCNFSNQFMEQGRDFDVVNRARKLKPTEYTYNKRLGYISLNQSLNYDEVLCVAYQYTNAIDGKTYQVGEFSDQFPTGDQPLYLKLLKSTILNTKIAMWDLMMKNVYSVGGYQINSQDFQFQIFRMTKGVDLPYIDVPPVQSTPLLQVMGLDIVNVNGDKMSDGYFDFIEGTTILAANGRVYFPRIEPFGNDLKDIIGLNADTKDYIFQELYDSTKVIAQQQTKKNVYKIKGQYKSSSSSEISLNALNVPQGSVSVTAGGVPLTENVDYTVDYTLGRVKIINESILNSGQPIKVSSESNSMFNIQQKSLIGTRLDYKVNKDFALGGTFLRLTERPLTQKVNFGDEPVSNIMWGFDFNHRADAPWLTRLVDKIPLINTKEKSTIQTQGEFAQLIAGHSRAINTAGSKSGNSYLDDFEGSISQIDLRSAGAWSLSSIPQGIDEFPEATMDSTYSGYNRAKLAYYQVDQSVFYLSGALTPPNITKNIQSNNFMRVVVETELFPNKQPPNGQPVLMPMLDLSFYPNERGPYNFDVAPTSWSSGIDFANSNSANGIRLNNPESRWGGIMRKMENPDFQTANIEFIQFWMMDPFNSDYAAVFPGYSVPQNGEMLIQIGNISEDILKDGKMSFENGIPKQGAPNELDKVDPTAWGYVSNLPIITPAFDIDETTRGNQDVGFDGLKDTDEQAYFTNYINAVSNAGGGGALGVAQNDPSGDDYHYYRGDDFDNNPNANTLYRYKWFNNLEGNSPTQTQYEQINAAKYSTVGSNVPNSEDVNKDNTLSETEAYYQYRLKITPQDLSPGNVGNNFITSVYQSNFTDANGNGKTVNWYQIKIPINSYEQKVGSIEGFNSIRFMRTVMRNFSAPVVCRLARFELVRSDWRQFDGVGAQPGDYLGGPGDGTTFDVSAVNIQENGSKSPVNYVIPPGINQQQNVQTTNLVLLNEQALVLRTCGLQDGYAKAAYKNFSNDVRSYKHMKMFVHAEQLGTNPLADGEMELFVRFGTDFVSNYYEYVVPLKLTAPGNYSNSSDDDRSKVWPDANAVDIDFEQMVALKFLREAGSIDKVEKGIDGGKIIRLIGNPTISELRTIMIGIRNPKDLGNEPKCVEVWVNELRLTDFVQKGGWAANARVTAKMADFGQLALSGSYMTPFFGSIEKKISERSRETNLQYDASTTLQLGKFFPADWKINLPLFLNRGEIIATPQFDPSNPDVYTKDIKNYRDITKDGISEIKSRGQDYTRRRGFNFSNVSKQRSPGKTKSHFWDIENFSVTYSYSEQYKHNITQELNLQKNIKAALSYGFTAKPKAFEPFKKTKIKLLNNKWFALVKDINFTPAPSQVGFNTDITRNFNEYKSRNISSDASIPAQFNKTFFMNRVYDLKWDFTKALKFTYNATNNARVLEPIGLIDTKEEKDVIKKNILAGGINTTFQQSGNLNYTIPINKIPILDWVTSTASYKANYQFTRRPFAADSLGNTIQNGNTISLNGQLNFVTLYNKIPYFKRINTGQKKNAKGSKGKSTKDNNPKDSTKKKEKDFKLLEHIARLIMTVKQAQVTYSINNGSSLPGYLDSTKVFGMNPNNAFHPGLPFVAGSQRDVLNRAERDSLLIRRNNLSNPFAQTNSKQLNFTAKLEPFKDFRIDITGTRSIGYNSSQYVGWNSTTKTYTSNTFTQTGNFSISIITINSAFQKNNKDDYSNAVFTKFLSYRETYAQKLAESNTFSDHTKNSGGYDGYSLNQQDVILNSFIAAYTGKGPGKMQDQFPKIPMPNWTLNYDGLSKMKFMKKHFKSVTIRHGYKSTYNVGSFSNNLLFTPTNGQTFDQAQYSPGRVDPTNGSSNFASKYAITAVTIQESFSPLVKVDIVFNEKKGKKKPDGTDGKSKGSLTGNFEIKKDRTVALNANIPQITETNGREISIGTGYRYPKLKINRFKIKGKPLESDLNCKVDLSLRNNVTTQRRVVDGINVPSQGTNIITLKTSVDYALSQNINLRLYFDKIINKPVVSTSFPTANTNAGFSLRFSLAQ